MCHTGTFEMSTQAEEYCATAPRFFAAIHGLVSPPIEKLYKVDANWVLWSWLPILVVVGVMHFIWALLMRNQGN